MHRYPASASLSEPQKRRCDATRDKDGESAAGTAPLSYVPSGGALLADFYMVSIQNSSSYNAAPVGSLYEVPRYQPISENRSTV